MFAKKPNSNKTGLQETIDELIHEMKSVNGDSDEYAKMAAQLDTLYKLKEVDHKIESDKHVSADTLAAIAANLAGILIIVNYERAFVATSKALSMLKVIK